MATKFRLRRSATADKRPVESDLLLGELALNTYDGRLYTKRDTNNVGIADTAALLTPWTENFGGGSIYYNNNVGIGEDTPGAKLAIYDSDGHNLYLRNSWSGEAGIGFGGGTNADGTGDTNTAGRISVTASAPGGAATGYMSFKTNSGDDLEERLRIDSGGTTRLQRNTYNTGAVTVSNAALYLDIGSTEGAVNINQLIGFGYRNAVTSAKPAYIGYQATTWSGHTRGDLIFGTRDTTTATDEATERLRITHDGKVGIGTDNPDTLLHAEGSGSTGITFEGSSSNTNALSGDPGTYLVLKNKSATDGNFSNILGTDAGGQATSQISFINEAQSTNAGVLAFGTRVADGSMTERLRIKSDGGMRLQKNDGNANFTISRNASVTTTDQAIGVVDFASNTAHTVQARLMGKTRGTTNVGGDLVVETRADGGSLDERVRFTGSGKVGIGSALPDYMLDVSGAINSETDIKVGGVSVSETALNDAVAMAIALG